MANTREGLAKARECKAAKRKAALAAQAIAPALPGAGAAGRAAINKKYPKGSPEAKERASLAAVARWAAAKGEGESDRSLAQTEAFTRAVARSARLDSAATSSSALERAPRLLRLGETQGNELAMVVTAINILARGSGCSVETIARAVRKPVRVVRNMINRQVCNVQAVPGVRLLPVRSYEGEGNGKLVGVRLAEGPDDAPLVAAVIAREKHLAQNHLVREQAIRDVNAPIVTRRALAAAERALIRKQIDADVDAAAESA